MNVPFSFLRYQAPNIAGMFGYGLLSALPRLGSRGGDAMEKPLHRSLSPVPPSLIAAYAEWTGAPAERYRDVVPPHMFSYWGLALVSELTGRAPYNLLSILNQGCRMVTRRPLPAGEKIEVDGRLSDISDDGRRVRICTHLEAGTASAPNAQSIDIMTAVPHKNPKGGKKKSRPDADVEFETVGTWSAAADDGLNFAMLTGDFNPLHTLPPLGRRTRHGTCILHGFGQLSRTYEAIRNAGIEIGVFDVRYIKPVPLPSDELSVELAREPGADGQRPLRLRSPDGTLHLVGHMKEEVEA